MKKRFKKIYIEITNICNLDCSFCVRTKKKKREMTIEEFKIVIDKIKDYTDYVYLHVQGEPLLHSHFKELLDICSNNNIKVNLTTNGTMLSKYIDVLNDCKTLRQINISLHSDNKIEDYYDMIFKTCKKLSSHIYISYRIWNLNSLAVTPEIKIIVNKLKKYYNISTEVGEKIINDKSIKIDINTFVDKDNLFNWPVYNNDISTDGYCYGLKTHIGILSDGTVVPCCLDKDGEIELGNIFKEDLNEILEKEFSKNIIKGFNDGKAIHLLCKKCDFRNRFIK